MVAKKKHKLSSEQINENKKRKSFSRQIAEVFTFSGFKKINVYGKQFFLGNRQNELDHCFIYENIIVICEDTIREKKNAEKIKASGGNYNKNHKLEKQETAVIIENDKKGFIDILLALESPPNELSTYKHSEFKIFYLYFDYGVTHYDSQTIDRYPKLHFVDMPTLNYLHKMASSIKHSFRFEIFKFLKLKKSDIGKPDPNGGKVIKSIVSPIIYPDSVTGFSDGVRMVSFMMKPSDLIENCCVLRKDGWENNADLYQRLITVNRIKSIRNHVLDNQTAFLNNIIVTLPDDVRFIKNSTNEIVDIDEIVRYTNDIKIEIPSDFNSMAIIDGQHRVYAYYEDSDPSNPNEIKMSRLRNELNLLVTGIIFPKTSYYADEINRRKFESTLFVSINKNAKPVDADTLIQVQTIMNPSSGEALSRKVIEILNDDDPFVNMFQLSKVEEAPIKTASIIQYALSSLLVAKNNENSLYHYWILKNSKPEDFELSKSEDIKDYTNYAANCLKQYFKAVKSRFLSAWNKDSKLLKVISINAFIITLRDTLKSVGGPKNYEYYFQVFQKLNIDFNGQSFEYGGAQYSKFAKDKLIPLFAEPDAEAVEN